jgi:hypothetical protein
VTGRRLLRLYPRRWRDRYGDELTGLLDDLAADPGWGGPGPARDVLRGAVDARLNFWRYPGRAAVPSPGWPPRAVLAGTGAVALLIAVSLALYPANLRDPAAPAGLAAAAVLLTVYLNLAVRAQRRPGPGRVAGVCFGAAAALLWTAEIWAGGPARLSYASEQLVGGLFQVLAVLFTVAAGLSAGFRGRPGTPGRAGLFAGLTSGLLVFFAAIVLTLSTLSILATRPDYQHEFAASGDPNISTYLVGDILMAGIAHLAINLLLGLIGGGLGELIARFRRVAPAAVRRGGGTG